jgi:two-component system chemotaxis response regulator CheB
LDFVPKPRSPSFQQNIADLSMSLSRLISIARTRKYSRQVRGFSETSPVIRQKVFSSPKPEMVRPRIIPPPIQKPDKPDVRPPPKETVRKSGRIDVVVIGVSTGGPNALQEIIPRFHADFPVPILTVQHMPAMFTASLANRLDSLSQIRVYEAHEGMPVQNGVMLIAPGGFHMVVRKDESHRKVIGVLDSPPVNSCRPSADVLFRSAAMIYGGHVLAVIMTGMGHDGLAGVAAILRKGGYTIVQDEKSSVIWGMPGAVVAADAADEIVSLHRMPERISEIVRKGCL